MNYIYFSDNYQKFVLSQKKLDICFERRKRKNQSKMPIKDTVPLNLQ